MSNEENYISRRNVVANLKDVRKNLDSLKKYSKSRGLFEIEDVEKRFMTASDLLLELSSSIEATIPNNVLIVYGKHPEKCDFIAEKAQEIFGHSVNIFDLYNNAARISYWEDPVAYIKTLPTIDALIFADNDAADNEMAMSLVGIVVTSYEPKVYKWEYKSMTEYEQGSMERLDDKNKDN